MKKEMKSPITDSTGNRNPLKKVTLEEGLTAYQCQQSQGVYIPLEQYWNWIAKQPERLEHLPKPTSETDEVSATVVAEESEVKLCPETDTIMLRFKMGNGFDFYVDRSRTGGVWLDAGEWEALRERQFHDEIHLVFTEPWQRKAREEAIKQNTQERLEERFESELLGEMDAIKAKLRNHPYRAYALAYLEE